MPFDPKQLRDPDPIHRPAPFWAINDRLDPEEVARQARDMRAHGFGGGFFHSRSGLLTEYLSDEWFAAFGGALQAGRETGFLTWMYDEDLWPSGFAGGLVLDRDPDFAERYLKVAKAGTELNERCTPVACFELTFGEDGKLAAFQRLPLPPAPSPAAAGEGESGGEASPVVFYIELMAPTPRFGGQPYADLGNAEAMKVFIEMSYESYAQKFPKELGNLIPGCFTDEPAIHNPGDGCAWSRDLRDVIQQRHGYDIWDCLPLLFFEGPGYEKVRFEYRRALNLLFVEAFTKQCADWCGEHGIVLTGHYLLEDNLEAQIATGGAIMPHYEYEQLPGIDFLCLRLEHEITMHQVRSAARQFGRKKILSELFGVSGAQCSFEDQKWMGDYHLVHGVNFFCQHLTLYSMRGQRKRDYPPTISYQNPYWPVYGRLNDYFARLGYALGEGKAVCDLLVLHPVGTGYVYFTPGQAVGPAQDGSKMHALDEDFMKLTQSLMRSHREFDYGDEEIMERHGRVEQGQLVLGEMAYSAVVVPPSLTWRRPTVELLKQFLEAGGKVLFVYPVPSMVGGVLGDEWRALLAHPNATVRTNHAEVIERALGPIHRRDVQFSGGGADGLLYQHRRVDGCDVYFIINTSRHNTAHVQARLQGKGPVTLYDAFTDTRYALAAREEGDLTVCELRVPPVGSVMLWLGEEQDGLPTWQWPAAPEEVIQLDNSWERERLEPNALTLDMATVEVEGVPLPPYPSPQRSAGPPGEGERGGEASPRRVIYRIRRDLQRAMGFGDLVGLQPWRVVYQGHKTDSGKTVKLRFEFECAVDPEGRRFYLVIEQGMGDRVTANGAEVSLDTTEWHWDIHFRKLDIAAHVTRGTNVIEVTHEPYDFLDMVEEVYLVGDFGVRMIKPDQPEVVAEWGQICTGNWVDQGYPFYSGRMIYRQTVEVKKRPDKAYRLTLHQPSGAGHLIRVNGQEAAFLVSEPWHADITDLLRDGENTVEIEVVGTMRNTFGPLHLKSYRVWIGPEQFEEDHNWEPQYHFHPYGLIEGAALEVCARP